MLWKVTDFEKNIIHIYVLLQKYQELYTYYKIDTIDRSIETEIQDFQTKLFELKNNTILIKNNYEYSYQYYTHLAYSNIQKITSLKYEIETSKIISKLHSLVMNLKVHDYLRNSKIEAKDFSHLLEKA